MADGGHDLGAGDLLGRSDASPPRRPPPRGGRRARLRERLDAHGAEALDDEALVELLLYRAIPRRDVAPLARRLVASFGDLAGVVAAAPSRLAAVQGMGPASVAELKLVEACARRLARARVLHRPVLGGWSALVGYCRTAMAARETEQLRCLWLDGRNRLIADEVLGEGTVDHVPAYPREIARRALAHNASALILVHNHPSGDPTPSAADVRVTREVEAALATLGVVLHDHVVIGHAREASLRALGHLGARHRPGPP